MASIRKRAKSDGGGYQVRYYGPDNKVRAKTFKTKKEAVNFSNEVETSVSKGDWIDPSANRVTLADFLVEYLQTSVHWRPSTRLKVEGHVRNYIEPSFGAWLVSRRPGCCIPWTTTCLEIWVEGTYTGQRDAGWDHLGPHEGMGKCL